MISVERALAQLGIHGVDVEASRTAVLSRWEQLIDETSRIKGISRGEAQAAATQRITEKSVDMKTPDSLEAGVRMALAMMATVILELRCENAALLQ